MRKVLKHHDDHLKFLLLLLVDFYIAALPHNLFIRSLGLLALR